MRLDNVELGFSRRYASLVILAHACAVAAIITCAVGLLWQFGLMILLVVNFCRAWRQPSHRYYALNFEDAWRLVDQNGVVVPVSIGAGTVITRWLVVLVGRTFAGGKIYVPVFGDTLSKDDFRRLQVIARTTIR